MQCLWVYIHAVTRLDWSDPSQGLCKLFLREVCRTLTLLDNQFPALSSVPAIDLHGVLKTFPSLQLRPLYPSKTPYVQ